MSNLKPQEVINKITVTDRWGNKKVDLTTSQIRIILARVNAIYNKILVYQGDGTIKGDELPDDILDELQYLKIKLIYQSGRHSQVKKFVEIAGLNERIDNIGRSKKEFIKFNQYIEALVAYHRFEGGRDS